MAPTFALEYPQIGKALSCEFPSQFFQSNHHHSSHHRQNCWVYIPVPVHTYTAQRSVMNVCLSSTLARIFFFFSYLLSAKTYIHWTPLSTWYLFSGLDTLMSLICGPCYTQRRVIRPAVVDCSRRTPPGHKMPHEMPPVPGAAAPEVAGAARLARLLQREEPALVAAIRPDLLRSVEQEEAVPEVCSFPSR